MGKTADAQEAIGLKQSSIVPKFGDESDVPKREQSLQTCSICELATREDNEKPAETRGEVRMRGSVETHQTRSVSGRFGAAGRSRAHKLDISTHADPPLPKLDTFLRLCVKTFALLFTSN